MGRTAKGSVVERSGKLYARVTLASGKRVTHLLGTRAELSDAEAQRLAVVVSDGYRSGRFVHSSEQAKPATEVADQAEKETVDRWFARWTIPRADWVSHVGSERSKYAHRIRPVLGHLAMVDVTRDDCERLVESLDRLVDEGTIAAKTATSTWAVAQAIFRDAYKGKDRRFRARSDDPTADVAPPDKGDNKARVYLYPDEAVRLLTSDDVPLERRRLYALAIYSGLRASELAALRWADVDLAADVIDVTKAEDRSVRKLRSTKNHETRRVPISPALRPLLEAMRQREGLVVPVAVSKLAESFRRDLRVAGLRRPSLFASSRTQKPCTFHDLRATAITWWALEGLPLHVVMRRAGHLSPQTTMIYIREAETLGRGIGLPFPALPVSLGNRHQESAPITKNEVKVLKARSHLGDLNPNKPGESTTNTGESTGSSDRLGGSCGAFCHPGADWVLPFSGLVERLGRAAAEGSCTELRQVANDVIVAWDRAA